MNTNNTYTNNPGEKLQAAHLPTHDNAHEVRTDPAAQGTQESATTPAAAAMPHAEYIRQVCARALELVEREGLDHDRALSEATREVTTQRHAPAAQEPPPSQGERSLGAIAGESLATLLADLPQKIAQRLEADEVAQELFERAEQLLMSLEWLEHGASVLSGVDPARQLAVRRCYETNDKGLTALGTLVELELIAHTPMLAAELLQRFYGALERALLGQQPAHEAE